MNTGIPNIKGYHTSFFDARIIVDIMIPQPIPFRIQINHPAFIRASINCVAVSITPGDINCVANPVTAQPITLPTRITVNNTRFCSNPAFPV